VALADKEEAKQLLYKGVQCVPESTDLWLALAKLENYENAKQVLNNAISIIPTD
jgi:pre-mRNA-processing factor 6